MTAYGLYVESGPKHRKTMVHALDLLGCVAVGPTTEAALDATPDAIRAFVRFRRRHGEEVDPDATFTTYVAEHVTEGDWLGNGSPYLAFAPDLEAPTDEEIEGHLGRFRWLVEELADWARTRSDAELDEPPEGSGRTARSILLHILGSTGPYLAAALGGAPGFSRVATAAERHEMGIPEALLRTADLARDRVHATTPEERRGIRQSPAGPRTLRKALRRMLEHPWEHLAELSRRPGGPLL
ncbi:MAG TPA: DinB family protein [Candidatus Acidoferrales bacterium]|nr:DinB family protein [Candidatus Acidoferrales bacterium]